MKENVSGCFFSEHRCIVFTVQQNDISMFDG